MNVLKNYSKNYIEKTGNLGKVALQFLKQVEFILVFIYNINEVINMTVDTNTIVSITEANQNFSKVARLVDEHGTAVILKNNVPRYLVIDFSKVESDSIASDEDVIELSKRYLEKNKNAYEVLAK